MRFRGTTGVLAALALTATLAACGDGEPEDEPSASTPPATSSAPAEDATLSLGVFGPKAELKAYRTLAQQYVKDNPGLTVNVLGWPSEQAMIADLLADHGPRDAGPDQIPDLFLAGRANLDGLVEADEVVPVDEFLDARGIAFGEKYSRQAMEAFSEDRRLQCMPYGATPTVAYYNADLVDFDSFPEGDIEPPTPDSGKWDIEQFGVALENSVAGRRNKVAGVYVQPTLSGLAPWLVADGGQLFDDPAEPTTTTFSDDASKDALNELLPLLSNPRYRLTDAELGGQSAVDRFKAGRLGVIVGDRSLVPQLRGTKGLDWDVMQLPGNSATTGDYTGLCMSAQGTHPDLAADLLAYLISDEAVTQVTRSGYLVPANQAVAYGDQFQDGPRKPANAMVYVDAIRTMQVMPTAATMKRLDRATVDQIRALFGAAWATRLETVTENIDATTHRILSPEDASTGPSASPSQP